MLRARTALKRSAKLGLRVKAAQMFSLAEPDFARVIFRVENDPLFKKIRPFVRRLPFKPSGFYLAPFDEASAPAGCDPIPWSEHQHEMELIRRLGKERFQRYFLSNDEGMSPEQISVVCGLSHAEVVKIRQFVFSLAIQSHTLAPAGPDLTLRRNYTCLAKVAIADGRPEIRWMLPHLARGRYGIDYDGLRDFQKTNLSGNEKIRLKGILGTLELVNLRHNSLWRVLRTILDDQSEFLKTESRQNLKALTAAQVSRKLKLHPSTISRIARGRSLLLPWGEEFPLERLLPNRKTIMVRALSAILTDAGSGLTDEDLRRALHNKSGVRLARRTINDYRREAMKG